ncbi:MAG: pyrroline-5-carboxylate reductase [Eubacterium sp.]
MKKIGFIGFGNMGRALCDGLIKSGAVTPDNIYASAKDKEKLRQNAAARNINACEDNLETAISSDIVVIAVKPDVAEEVITPIRSVLNGKIVVSIAAGLGFYFYEQRLESGTNHISVLPNTPVAVCRGVIVCEEKHSLTDEQLETFKEIFSKIALIEFIGPKAYSAAGTIGGCGPAFAAMFIEALGDAGVKYGMKRDAAYRIAAQMLAGTAELELETGAHPGAMKDAVCSPGGTTIRGVASLEKNGFRSAVIEAVDAVENK